MPLISRLGGREQAEELSKQFGLDSSKTSSESKSIRIPYYGNSVRNLLTFYFLRAQEPKTIFSGLRPLLIEKYYIIYKPR